MPSQPCSYVQLWVILAVGVQYCMHVANTEVFNRCCPNVNGRYPCAPPLLTCNYMFTTAALCFTVLMPGIVKVRRRLLSKSSFYCDTCATGLCTPHQPATPILQIIPIENIEGRKAVEEGETCLRKTFSGVDLNRNWGTEWKQQVGCSIS